MDKKVNVSQKFDDNFIKSHDLLLFINNYDCIDITNVSTIVGTSHEMIDMIISGKYLGFDTVDLVVLDDINSTTLSFLSENTAGTIETITNE